MSYSTSVCVEISRIKHNVWTLSSNDRLCKVLKIAEDISYPVP